MGKTVTVKGRRLEIEFLEHIKTGYDWLINSFQYIGSGDKESTINLMWKSTNKVLLLKKVYSLESIIIESRILWINIPISCTSNAVLITLVTIRLKSKPVAFSI